MRRDAEADSLERRSKQRAVLEAVAAAAIDDHLSDDAVEVDADAAAEQHVHVLEGNTGDVCPRQTGERLERGLDRPTCVTWARPTDAREIRVESEGVHRKSIESTP